MLNLLWALLGDQAVRVQGRVHNRRDAKCSSTSHLPFPVCQVQAFVAHGPLHCVFAGSQFHCGELFSRLDSRDGGFKGETTVPMRFAASAINNCATDS